MVVSVTLLLLLWRPNLSPAGGIPCRLQTTSSSRTPADTQPELESGRMSRSPRIPHFPPHTHGGAPATSRLSPGSVSPSGESPNFSEQPFLPSSSSLSVLEHVTLTQLYPCRSLSLGHPNSLLSPIKSLLVFQGLAQAPSVPQILPWPLLLCTSPVPMLPLSNHLHSIP